MTEQAWLIPVVPLVSFFIIIFLGKRTPLRGAAIGILAVGISFVLSLLVFGDFVGGAEPIERSTTWFRLATFELE
ncbi:MAG: NADH-quinone oxidoreductase subunit L, partial [Candidatus Limnocylindria bacterium]